MGCSRDVQPTSIFIKDSRVLSREKARLLSDPLNPSPKEAFKKPLGPDLLEAKLLKGFYTDLRPDPLSAEIDAISPSSSIVLHVTTHEIHPNLEDSTSEEERSTVTQLNPSNAEDTMAVTKEIENSSTEMQATNNTQIIEASEDANWTIEEAEPLNMQRREGPRFRHSTLGSPKHYQAKQRVWIRFSRL